MSATTRPHVLALVAVIALGAAACSSDPNDTSATTTVAPATTAAGETPDTTPTTTPGEATAEKFDIVGTALAGVVFTQLAGMVVDAGLVATLRSPGPFTVFAPTDDAFAKLPLAALHGVQDDPDLLATVLTYHVVAGALTLADLEDGPLETVAGIDVEVSRDGDTVLINGSPIVAGDIEATNGIIHVMGDVLLPPG